jgi:prepilin-type N-terminal cleavage/methylation domain-containing protein
MNMMKRKKNGFTILELLIVLSIMAALFALTVGSLTSLNKTQSLQQETQNVLTSLKKARSLAMNAQVSQISDNWVYGYVYALDLSSANSHGYCIYKWYVPNSDPTSTIFVFPGTLSQNYNSLSIDNSSLGTCSVNSYTSPSGWATITGMM